MSFLKSLIGTVLPVVSGLFGGSGSGEGGNAPAQPSMYAPSQATSTSQAIATGNVVNISNVVFPPTPEIYYAGEEPSSYAEKKQVSFTDLFKPPLIYIIGAGFLIFLATIFSVLMRK